MNYNNYNVDSLLSNSAILSKNRNLNHLYFTSDLNLNNSNISNKAVLKIKTKSKINFKENELPLYKGEINYNNVSSKNVKESIKDLMNKYKLKGYTCLKKDKNKFKFVKGPYIHNVELTRLGNGLLYYNINKL